eukprot:gene41923-51959_t
MLPPDYFTPMKMQTTPRVEPTFGDAPPAVAAPEPVEPVWLEAGESHQEPQMAPPAGAAAPAHPDAPPGAAASAAARRALPVKTLALGGAAAAGLIAAIVWIGNAAQEQRHRPPQPKALAAPAGMSAKALPAPEVQTIAAPPEVPSAFVAPSEPQHAVPAPPMPAGAEAATPAAQTSTPAAPGTTASGTITAAGGGAPFSVPRTVDKAYKSARL